MLPGMRTVGLWLGLSALVASARGVEPRPIPLPGAGPVRAVAFSPDGQRLACGCDDATVRLIDPDAGKELKRLRHRGVVEAVAFASDGTLATAGRDRVIRLWNTDGTLRNELPGHRIGVTSLAFAADGNVLVSGGHDGVIRLWDCKTSGELRRLEGHEADVRAVAISADGSRVVSASYDRTIRLWDGKTGKELRLLVTLKREGTAVAITPDGRRIVGGSVQGRARLWDAETGDEAFDLDGGASYGSPLTYSIDGAMLAGVDGYGDRLVVWESHTGAVRRILPFTVRVFGIAFSPNVNRVALARGDGTVQIHRFVARRPIADSEEAWKLLSGTDGEAAFDAILTLATDPARSLAVLRRHVQPVRPLEEKRLRQLLLDLESDDFATRETATRELEAVSETIVTALRTALRDDKLSLDARTRLERILHPSEESQWSGERLRSARVVECLERMGSSEAQQFLEELGKGARGALLTEQARATLARSRPR